LIFPAVNARCTGSRDQVKAKHSRGVAARRMTVIGMSALEEQRRSTERQVSADAPVGATRARRYTKRTLPRVCADVADGRGMGGTRPAVTLGWRAMTGWGKRGP